MWISKQINIGYYQLLGNPNGDIRNVSGWDKQVMWLTKKGKFDG